MSNAWVKRISKKVQKFADTHSHTYNISKKKVYASFEIGCFHALLNHYEKNGVQVHPENLQNGEFRYLTSANGNPENFSYVTLSKNGDNKFQMRQNVRIRSHLNEHIAFTPDILVIKNDSTINVEKDEDYAKGKRRFFSVQSKDVVAAHECKSFPPFPELMVSFVGMLVSAHQWYTEAGWRNIIDNSSIHLAPTLFVGGCASNLHLKMIDGLEQSFPINIIVGMHRSTWDLSAKGRMLNRLDTAKIFRKLKKVKAA